MRAEREKMMNTQNFRHQTLEGNLTSTDELFRLFSPVVAYRFF